MSPRVITGSIVAKKPNPIRRRRTRIRANLGSDRNARQGRGDVLIILLHRIRTSRCAVSVSAVTILFAPSTRGAPLFPPLAKNHAQLLAPALVNSHQLAFDFGGQVAQQSV